MGIIIMLCRLIILLVGLVMFYIVAFRTSLLWRILCLLFSPAALIFLIKHWHEAKKSWFIQLAGVVIILIGVAFTPEISLNAILQTNVTH